MNNTASAGKPPLIFILMMGVFTLLIAGGGGFYIIDQFGNETEPAPAQILLPFLVIYGVFTLFIGIAFVSTIFARLDLTDRTAPMGLPPGSMHAFVALSLILIFVIVAIHLYNGAEDADRNDIALQLLTTVGTLAVAVAGFYFGTKQVETAAKAAQGAVAEPPALRVFPSSPVTLSRTEGQTLGITVETSPSGQTLVGKVVHGDEVDKITAKEPGSFEYTRGPSAGDVVVLSFSMKDRPSITAALEVRAENGGDQSPPPPPPSPAPAPAPLAPSSPQPAPAEPVPGGDQEPPPAPADPLAS